MNIFGDFYDNTLKLQASKKEQRMQAAEDWSAAILSGSNDKIQLEEPIKSRIYYLLGLAFLLLGAVMISRLAYLQIITGERNSLLASGNRIRNNAIAAPRGAIYDRNGLILARNNAHFDLVVIPAQLPQNEQSRKTTYDIIAALANKSPQEVQSIAESKTLRYSLPIVVVDNISRDTALNIEERHSELTGFNIDTNPTREYLDGGGLAPFLGYIGRISAEEFEANPEYRPIDMIGKTGLEKAYESDLRGVYGKEQTEVDATGLPVRALARVEPKPGNSVVLSIDKSLQDVMQQSVK